MSFGKQKGRETPKTTHIKPRMPMKGEKKSNTKFICKKGRARTSKSKNRVLTFKPTKEGGRVREPPLDGRGDEGPGKR